MSQLSHKYPDDWEERIESLIEKADEMTQQIKVTLSLNELESNGWVINPHLYIGSGWEFCHNCQKYTHHFAMSHRLTKEPCEVCKECNTTTLRRYSE